MDDRSGKRPSVVETAQALGSWSGSGSPAARRDFHRLAMAAHASAVRRERAFVFVVCDVYLRHAVLDLLLLGRPSAARRFAHSEFLGHVALYLLLDPTRLR